MRDLQADLEQAQPGVIIEEVNGFLIRGSGRVDDIKLFDSMESLYQDIDYGLAFNEQQGGGGLVGETIRILNGNMIEHRSDLSFTSPHSMGLSFQAAYNSMSNLAGSLGFGWSHTYSALLDPDFKIQAATYIKIVDQTGRAAYFLEETPGIFKGAFNDHSSVKIESGEYVWYRLDGSKYSFSASGQLTWIDDEKGNRLTLAYDASNLLETVTDDASGRILTFSYNADNRLTAISGPVTPEVPSGVHVTYGYDTNHNLISVTYADGSGFTYIYTDTADIHNLTGKNDKDSHIINTWVYDDQDRCIENTSVQGRGVSINYNDGSQVDVTDAYGTSRSYILQEMSGRKRVAAMQGSANATYSSNNNIRWGYDSQMRLVEVESKGGTINRFQDYDERGNPGTLILAADTTIERVITASYHPSINVILSRTEASVLGAGNKVTTWDYDDDYDNTPNESPTSLISRIVEQGYTRNLSGSIVPFEYITTITYNNKGQILTIDGPLSGTGDTTSFSYDVSTGDLLSVTRPLIGVTTFSNYDAAGRLGRVTDVNGQSKNFTYDGRGRITALTNEADGSSSTIAYNLSGFPDTTTDEDSVSRSFIYDTIYGRLANINDAHGNYIAYNYDVQGNRIEMSKHESSGTRTSRKRWDFQHTTIPGLLYREIKADDSYQQYGYDDEGNIISVIDYEGHTTTYQYDPLNRPISVNQPGDIVTGYGYDTQNNLTSVTDANNHVTSFIYDDMNRLVSTTSPDTGTKTYVYDAAGNTVSKTDANGINLGYTYDDLNRLINVNFPDSTQNITYTYDTGTNGIGRRTGMVDPSGTFSFSYDNRGRLSGRTSIINGFTYQITSTFTPGSRLSSFTYPSGRSIDYTRNTLGTWDTVSTTYNSNTITLAGNLSYRPFGIPNGMNTGSGGSISNTSGECDCLTVSNPGQPMEQTFTYDHNSNLKTIHGTNTPWYNQDFNYDDLNRLTNATGAYGSINYTYDNVGNRMTRTIDSQTETYTYIAGTNKLYQVNGTGGSITYAYDANGNITGINDKTLTYNQNNRLIRVEENSDILGEYQYNGLGQRVIKEADGVITVFHYDHYGKLIAESLADGSITTEYLYMGKIRMAKVDVATGSIYYYLNDRLGTPLILTDDTGKVVWEAEYKPFGEAGVNTNSEVVNNIRLPGQYYDNETGLHYNYHRYYDPTIGRYLKADPIGLAGGINPYTYSLNNPINLIDPLGLRALTEGEKNALRYYFGASLNVDAINLEISQSGSMWSPTGNNIYLPKEFFSNNSECEELKVDNPGIYAVFAHESLHVWQRQHGQNVTLSGGALQLGRILSFGLYDPYKYKNTSDPQKLLDVFKSGNIEQQGAIFQQYVLDEQRGLDTSRYDEVAQYVYWR
jgi:RHS repeat-associated protein